MAKLQKIETTHYIYEYELNEEELALYISDPDTFWEDFSDEWNDPYMDVDSTQPEINFLEE